MLTNTNSVNFLNILPSTFCCLPKQSFHLIHAHLHTLHEDMYNTVAFCFIESDIFPLWVFVKNVLQRIPVNLPEVLFEIDNDDADNVIANIMYENEQ